jgi:signal transduction histidine kinase
MDKILDALPAALLVLDDDLNIVVVNRAFHRILGLPADFTKPGDNIVDAISHLAALSEPDPAARARGVAERMALMAARKGFTYRRRFHHGRTIEVVGNPLAEGGQVVLFHDVTEAEARATALAREWNRREDEDRLLRAIDGLSTGVGIYDADDRLILHNAAYRRVIDLPAHIGVGARFRDVLETQIESGVAHLGGMTREAWLEARLAEHRMPGDKIFETRIGGDRLLQIRDQRLPDGGYAITLNDVTQARARQSELDRQAHILAGTFESIDEGVVVFDHNRVLIAWNERARRLLDMPPEAMSLGKTFDESVRHQIVRGDFGPIEDVEAEVRRRVVRVSRHEPYSDEGWRPNGRYIVTRRTALPGGGWVTLFTDLTDRKHAEDALRDAKETAEIANRTKSEFLANMSHELRTPLNAVIGFSEIIHNQLFGPIEEKRYVDYARDIHSSGTHLLQVINDILDISKAEAGKVDLRETQIDLGGTLAACARLMAPRAEAAQVRVSIEVAPDVPLLSADEQRVRQIVLNLLSNSVKFTPPGGRVRITATLEKNGGVAVGVADTGIGMRAQDIPRALEPFGQIDSALARRFEGTGLGLPLSRKLAELHGGTLTIESAPNRGTTAIVRFPPARCCG